MTILSRTLRLFVAFVARKHKNLETSRFAKKNKTVNCRKYFGNLPGLFKS